MPQQYKDYNWQCDEKIDPSLFILDSSDNGMISAWQFGEYSTSQKLGTRLVSLLVLDFLFGFGFGSGLVSFLDVAISDQNVC
jgi:hypothetical protein